MPYTDAQQLESLLVKALRSRGWIVRVPWWNADRIAVLDGLSQPDSRRRLNLTELAKELIKDIES